MSCQARTRTRSTSVEHITTTSRDTCWILTTNDHLTMAYLLKNLTNSIWHAFYALQGDTPGIVAKSKLKVRDLKNHWTHTHALESTPNVLFSFQRSQVLTANIGTLMDLYGVEKGLDDYRSTQSLTFDQFLYYLQREVSLTIYCSLASLTSSSFSHSGFLRNRRHGTDTIDETPRGKDRRDMLACIAEDIRRTETPSIRRS